MLAGLPLYLLLYLRLRARAALDRGTRARRRLAARDVCRPRPAASDTPLLMDARPTFRNAAALMAQRLLHIVAAALFALMVPRLMGPAVFGRYALLTSVSMWFAMLSGLGAVSVMTRAVPPLVMADDMAGLRRLMSSLLALRTFTAVAAASTLLRHHRLPARRVGPGGGLLHRRRCLLPNRGQRLLLVLPWPQSGCALGPRRPSAAMAHAGAGAGGIPAGRPSGRVRRVPHRQSRRPRVRAGPRLGLPALVPRRPDEAVSRPVHPAGHLLRRREPAARAGAPQRRNRRAPVDGRLRAGRLLRRGLQHLPHGRPGALAAGRVVRAVPYRARAPGRHDVSGPLARAAPEGHDHRRVDERAGLGVHRRGHRAARARARVPPRGVRTWRPSPWRSSRSGCAASAG